MQNNRKIVPMEDVDQANHPQNIQNSGSGGNSGEAPGFKRKDSVASLQEKLAASRSTSSRIRAFIKSITYECLKSSTKWLIENAKIDLTFRFSDIMMYMTLFVLYADEIRVLVAPKSADAGFDVATTICFFFFIFELVFGTWSKSSIKSIYEWDGYIFSFYFWLDVAAIVSMFPDVPIIADPLGIQSISNGVGGNSGLTKAGRVVRMVRLVRLVKLYKIAAERRAASRVERELQNMLEQGLISYNTLDQHRSMFQQRQSKVGSQVLMPITLYKYGVQIIIINVC